MNLFAIICNPNLSNTTNLNFANLQIEGHGAEWTNQFDYWNQHLLTTKRPTPATASETRSPLSTCHGICN